MFKQGDSFSRQINDGCFSQQVLGAKSKMIFVLTQENASLKWFYFKTNGKTFLGILKIALRLSDRHVFMRQSLGIWERFQGLNFETSFLKN